MLPVDSDSYTPIENFKDNAQQIFHHILSMKKKPFARQIPEKDWYRATIVSISFYLTAILGFEMYLEYGIRSESHPLF